MRYTNDEVLAMTELRRKGSTWQEIADRLNEWFNTSRTKNAVKCYGRKIGLAGEHEPYTREQDEWIKAHVSEYGNYSSMAMDFNRIFHTNKADRGLQSHVVRYLGIVSGRQAFKKGCIAINEHPLGTEFRNRANGYIYIKVKMTGSRNEMWQAKQRVIYSQEYGEIPKGCNVIFLNGDKSDFSIENLACISDRVNRILESRHWHFTNKDLTRAAIKIIELEDLCKGATNGTDNN